MKTTVRHCLDAAAYILRCSVLPGLCLATMMMVISPAWAASAYWKCSAGRIFVVTNSSASRCERLIGAVTRYEEVLSDLVGMESAGSLPPLTLYSLTREDAKRFMFSEEEIEEQRRTRIVTHSKYLPGIEDIVGAVVDQAGDEPIQAVLFMHGQQMLYNEAARSYPMWYQLGVAALLNGLAIKPDGTVLLSRNPMFAARLEGGERKAKRLEISELLNAQPSQLSPADMNEVAERAHVWAQFGLLTTEARRNQYRELALLMRQGTPLEEASQQAFGKPFADVQAEFNSARWRSEVAFRFPPSGKQVTMTVPVQVETVEFDSHMKSLNARVIEFL